MKAIIAYSLLVPLAFALSVYCCTLAFASRDSQPPQSSDLGLEVDSRDVDFGAVEQNRVVHGQFVLHNRSTAIIVVREVAKSCGCTTAEISAREIHPGGTAFLDVTWTLVVSAVETRKLLRSSISKTGRPRRWLST